jgi:hypothetical protein
VCSAIWDSRDDGDMIDNLRAIALYSGSIALMKPEGA